MPVTMFGKCKEIMRIAKESHDEQISWAELEPIIKRAVGSHPTTIKNYRRELQAFGFIKRLNDFVFTIEEVKE